SSMLCNPAPRRYNKFFNRPEQEFSPAFKGAAISDALNVELRGEVSPAEEAADVLSERKSFPQLSTASSEWPIIAITSVGHTLCHTAELVFAGVLIALKREFELPPDQVTLLGLAGYMLMGVGAIPVGLWTDRLGSRYMLILYFFGMAAA